MADNATPTHGPPKPTEHHAKLRPFEGRFRARVTIHVAPGQSLQSTGIMNNSFQLGGLYLHQDYVGDRSAGPFPSFEGKGYFGFNTSTGKYEGFWIDNASTMMQVESGYVDATGKVWTMFGEVVHPATGKAMKKRSVITLIDDDHHRMDAYFALDEKSDFRTMEIEYTRTTQ